MADKASDVNYSNYFGLFYHSILYRFIVLTGRLGENLAIDPIYNDVAVNVGDLIVSCFHFSDQVRVSRPEMAEAICSFADYNKIADIANTHKHYSRNVKSREARIEAFLAYELSSDGKVGFICTEAIAKCPAWGEIDCFDLIQRFIGHCIEKTGMNKGMYFTVEFKAINFHDVAKIRFTEKTFIANGTSIKCYKRNDEDQLVPASGVQVELELVYEVERKIQVGAWTLDFGELSQ